MSLAPQGGVSDAPRFCRQCGVPLRGDGRFCRHCGADVSKPSMPSQGTTQVAAVAPLTTGGLLTGAMARGRERHGALSRLPVMAKLGVLFLGLVLIGGVVQATQRSVPPPTCTYNCTTVRGPLQAMGESFTSPLFSFHYPPVLTEVAAQAGAMATFHDGGGNLLLIFGGSGTPSLSTLLQQYSQKLSGIAQNITALGPIYGAEIGFVPGAGEFYSGQLQTQSGISPVGLGVVVAESGGSWAVVLVGAFCTGSHNGQLLACSEIALTKQQESLGNSQAYDDILAHWHWGAQ